MSTSLIHSSNLPPKEEALATAHAELRSEIDAALEKFNEETGLIAEIKEGNQVSYKMERGYRIEVKIPMPRYPDPIPIVAGKQPRKGRVR
jgi:hypothetical protein